MSDIVNRLKRENSLPPVYGPPRIQEEAADTITALRAEVERLKQREKDLILEGLSYIGRLGQVREVLAGTDADSLLRDYPTLKMAHDRMGDLMKARAEVERLTGERDRQYDQNAEQITRIASLEAEIEKLRAALEAWDNAVQVTITIAGPSYLGVSKTLAIKAWEKTRAALEEKT